MPFTVQYPADIALQGQMAQQAGQGALALDQQRLQLQQDAVNRDFAERQRQFDIRTQMDYEESARREQLAGQQMQNAAYGQQLDFQNQERNRQADLIARQMGYQQQSEMAAAEWAMQSAPETDKQIAEQMKQLRQMQFDPEGQRLFNELAGKQRIMMAQRGTLRPEQYAQLQSQFMEELSAAGLEQYEVKEPTAEEQFRKTLTRTDGIAVAPPGQPLHPGRYTYIGMRNGVPTPGVMWVDDPALSYEENVQQRVSKLPDGSTIYEDRDGKTYPFNPPKPEASNEPTQREIMESDRDYNLKRQKQEAEDYRADRELALKELSESMRTGDDGKTVTMAPPPAAKLDAHAAKLSAARRAQQEASNQSGQNPATSSQPQTTPPPQNAQPSAPPAANPATPGQPVKPPGQGTAQQPYDMSGLDEKSSAAFLQGVPEGTYLLIGGVLHMKKPKKK